VAPVARPDGARDLSMRYAALPTASRTQGVRAQIKAAIDRGDYEPGDRLPSERELAELLGVSRVSVREAIRALEAVGRVRVQRGRGCFVAETAGSRYVTSFSQWLVVHRDEALELLKIRGALDELAAESAAEVASDAGISRLRTLNADFAAAADEGVERLAECDLAFHTALAEAGGGPLLAHVMRELHEAQHESRLAALASPERARASARDHQAIVDAIGDGDPGAARAAVARHVELVREFLASGPETTETEDIR
jgi:GntR family transcriptional repressor for pyruvate dehydrogenase complex